MSRRTSCTADRNARPLYLLCSAVSCRDRDSPRWNFILSRSDVIDSSAILGLVISLPMLADILARSRQSRDQDFFDETNAVYLPACIACLEFVCHVIFCVGSHNVPPANAHGVQRTASRRRFLRVLRPAEEGCAGPRRRLGFLQ